MKHADLIQAQASLLIAEMAKGHSFLPFLKPGDPAAAHGLPYNPTSGKAYRGGNMVMLWIAGLSDGFTDRRWLTYKQAQSLGAQVKKGAQSVPLRYFAGTTREEQREGKSDRDADASASRLRAFYFNVFNAEQIDGMPMSVPRPTVEPFERIARCEALLKASGATVVHGAQGPHYAPGPDRIGLPDPDRFVSREAYYAAALHELAHWSGHSSRLNRDLSGRFGSLSYAREELVAETASHIMGVELDVGHDPSQHAAYLAHWMTIAKEEPDYIYKAAAAAEKVCDFLDIERYQHEPLVAPTLDVEVPPFAATHPVACDPEAMDIAM
jgi:antirestriction protein ArdC